MGAETQTNFTKTGRRNSILAREAGSVTCQREGTSPQEDGSEEAKLSHEKDQGQHGQSGEAGVSKWV